jgi:FAD:protein FMN transferase
VSEVLASASFRAMGTDVHVLGVAGPTFAAARNAVERRFTQNERRFSRFRRDSELSRVNDLAGRWTPISPEFRQVMAFALDAAVRTEGRVTPTVLHAVQAAGYARDFDDLLTEARTQLHPAAACTRAADVVLEEGQILLPVDVGIDLGGFAKGYTVDRAAHEALESGARWIVVNAGGDLRVLGDAPALTIAVEDPEDARSALLELQMAHGAIATSSVVKRSWGTGHHLIDPFAGTPATTDAVQATVWGPTCAEAEVLAKDVVLRGAEAAVDVESVIVLADGTVLVSFDTVRTGPQARSDRRDAA